MSQASQFIEYRDKLRQAEIKIEKLEKLQQNFELKNKQNIYLQKLVDEGMEAKELLQQDKSDLKEKNIQLLIKLENKMKKKKQLNETLACTTQNYLNLQNKFAELEMSSNTELENLEKKLVEKYENELKKVNTVNQELQETIKELLQKLQTLEEALNYHEQNNQKLMQEHESLLKKLSDTQQENKHLSENLISSSRDQQDKFDSNKRSLREKIAVLEIMIEQKNKIITQLQQQFGNVTKPSIAIQESILQDDQLLKQSKNDTEGSQQAVTKNQSQTEFKKFNQQNQQQKSKRNIKVKQTEKSKFQSYKDIKQIKSKKQLKIPDNKSENKQLKSKQNKKQISQKQIEKSFDELNSFKDNYVETSIYSINDLVKEKLPPKKITTDNVLSQQINAKQNVSISPKLQNAKLNTKVPIINDAKTNLKPNSLQQQKKDEYKEIELQEKCNNEQELKELQEFQKFQKLQEQQEEEQQEQQEEEQEQQEEEQEQQEEQEYQEQYQQQEQQQEQKSILSEKSEISKHSENFQIDQQIEEEFQLNENDNYQLIQQKEKSLFSPIIEESQVKEKKIVSKNEEKQKQIVETATKKSHKKRKRIKTKNVQTQTDDIFQAVETTVEQEELNEWETGINPNLNNSENSQMLEKQIQNAVPNQTLKQYNFMSELTSPAQKTLHQKGISMQLYQTASNACLTNCNKLQNKIQRQLQFEKTGKLTFQDWKQIQAQQPNLSLDISSISKQYTKLQQLSPRSYFTNQQFQQTINKLNKSFEDKCPHSPVMISAYENQLLGKSTRNIENYKGQSNSSTNILKKLSKYKHFEQANELNQSEQSSSAINFGLNLKQLLPNHTKSSTNQKKSQYQQYPQVESREKKFDVQQFYKSCTMGLSQKIKFLKFPYSLHKQNINQLPIINSSSHKLQNNM